MVSHRSSCSLTATVQLTLQRVVKFARKNKIRITLNISLPLRLDNSNFAVAFTALKTSDYSYNIITQDQSNLATVSFDI